MGIHTIMYQTNNIGGIMVGWRAVKGHENTYECSTDGVIRSKVTGKISRYFTKRRTKTLSVKLDGIEYKVAQLLLRTFVSEPPPSVFNRSIRRAKVIFVDGDVTNLNIDNLQWSDLHSKKPLIIEGFLAGKTHAVLCKEFDITPPTLHKILDGFTSVDSGIKPPTDIPGEEWKPIECGYKDIIDGYWVSNHGRIFALVGTNIKGRRVRSGLVKLQTNRQGYQVAPLLNKHLGTSRCMVHQLVMRNFCERDPERPLVDHIDRNTGNNHISNLRWCTEQENHKYARRSTEYEEYIVELRSSGMSYDKIATLVPLSASGVRGVIRRWQKERL